MIHRSTKRNSIRTEARSMMADEEMRKKLETERPNKTFEELVVLCQDLAQNKMRSSAS